MPTTVNGIGTHYYGKKNLVVRTAPCRSCHRVGVLESYDTRLWFVIAFIPVIPLGRKRIIDKCPSCTRHMAADANTYEQARQLQTSGSIEQYRREPSPESALEAHAQLLSFHEHEQAAEFRRGALERFPGHAGLRAGLASQLRQVASYHESAALYEEALALEPDLPEARVGVALRKMALGELDEARALLDVLEVPGAGQHYPLGPLDALAGTYQKHGRHDEALELAGHLLREVPEAGHQHEFRAFVRRSEKALRREESILPPRQHSLRGLFRAEGSPYPAWVRNLVLAGAALALLAAGLVINNEYIRRHRTIHVVNACGQPVQVQVDGGPAQAVADLGRVVVGEGRHRVKLSGPVDESHDVELRAGFFDRWFGKPLWVLNPGSEAVLQESTIYYAKDPRPSDHRLIVGQPFLALPRVDYAFEDPPASLKVEKASGEVVKTAVRRVQGNDLGAFLTIAQADPKGALAFAERRLRRRPEQTALLSDYMAAVVPQDRRRAESFLRSGLKRRPVLVQWHRAYQSLVGTGGEDEPLVALYDRFLKAEPRSGVLLYLRGRIEPDWDRQETFLRRSIEADRALPWPWVGLAARAAAGARWEESARDLRKARELKADEEHIREPLHVARLAAGEADELVKEYRARLASNPLDAATMVLLCEALAVAGQADQVEPEALAWAGRLPPEARDQLAGPLRAIALYQAGKLEESETLCRETASMRNGAMRVQALLALGRVEEVVADGSFKGAFVDPWMALAVSLALSLEGRADESARWRDRAIRGLPTLMGDSRRVARMLGAGEAMPADELDRVLIDPEDKALALAVLAGRFPARRAEYHAAASRFNVRRNSPCHLVRRAIEGKAPAVP